MKLRFALWLALLAALGGCSGGASRPPNILVLLVDTLRQDRVGVFGERKLTPFVDSFADRAYVFHNAFAQSSWTNPSVASILTSRFQSQHRVTWFDSLLSADELTLPEVLKQHGYATAAFSANFLLRGPSGFDQGFDLYRTFSRQDPDAPPARRFIKERAERLDREALAWLDRVAPAGAPGPPVFLYLHYMEPHNPYDPPDDLLDRVLAGRPRPDRNLANGDMNVTGRLLGPGRIQGIADLYDAEVSSLDAELRLFFAELDKRHFLDDTVVVFLADHGEELNEHGQLGHHKTLFEEVIRVPLLIRVPGQKTRVDVSQHVMLVDVAPTLLALAGIDRPASFEGRALTDSVIAYGALGKLRSWWSPAVGDGPPAFSQLIRPPEARRTSPHEQAVIIGGRKLIAGVNGEHEFYDLDADAPENDPNGLDEAARAQLTGALAHFLARVSARAAPGAVRSLDAETEERMRALGYHD